MKKLTVGSVCSGIEAASVAFQDLNYEIKWFSEVAPFPSQILKEKYPNTPNLGDMRDIPSYISSKEVDAPDVICGGTPCQAFSLAGWKKGLEDDRGNLTLKFVDIIESNDKVRLKSGLPRTVMLWENVEGVLKDETNPFGCFLSSLLGLTEELNIPKWPLAGAIHGPERNIAWRILDAKYFGLPHQRRRLYVLAGGKDFYPENVLFDKFSKVTVDYNNKPLLFNKNGQNIEVFRSYTDCLYSAYGTKWNGNAAAHNGSLFISQNEKIRRLTPLECERLMGFPDDYTYTEKVRPTNRYQALGNSWAVPVIKWIGERLENEISIESSSSLTMQDCNRVELGKHCELFQVPTNFNMGQKVLFSNDGVNGSPIPENPIEGNIQNIVDTDPSDRFYISPVGCKGILRRSEEKNIKLNQRLERALSLVSSTMSDEEIEKKSRVQKRGRFSPN
ncbi:MAG: restriction endonuclease subunit M [Candidatus Marinimicrobia bacterium]|nr:restriction endonuclease subunit M [Candidatus Neomarinimicrobiota bacterium]